MNIDQYREEQARIQSELEVEQGAQVEQTATDAVEQGVQEAIQEEQSSTEVTAEASAQVEQVANPDVERLQAELNQAKQYLKQAEEAKIWYDKINENPEYAQAFAKDKGLAYVDPKDRAVQELEQRYQTMLVEKEIQNLSIKYPDFNAEQVVATAVNKGLNNLEDAYLLSKVAQGTAQPATQSIDVEALKAQIRQELQNELQSQVSTTSMIGAGTGSQSVQPSGVELTAHELKVAQSFGISPAEYQKMKTIN